MKSLLTLLAGALLAVGAIGCGSGSEGSTSASAPSTSASSVTTPARAPVPTTTTGATSTTPPPSSSAKIGSSSSGKSAGSASSTSKRYPHGDNSIQTYGKPAGETDKQAVTNAVKRYYAALAAGDDTTACVLLSSRLSKSILRVLGRSPALHGKGCPAILSLLLKPQSATAGASLAAIEVTGVRVQGDRGFALLHSKQMPAGEIPVEREGGTWKVGGVIGSELP